MGQGERRLEFFDEFCMRVFHAFPHIEAVGIDADITACHFNENALVFLGNRFGCFQHTGACSLATYVRRNKKFQHFCYIAAVMELPVKAHIEDATNAAVQFA